MPEISVIIPAYNAEKTIGETIESVLNQTFRDFELIVIDDGSTDKTTEIVRQFNDPRLSVHAFSNKGSPSASRNRGTRLAKSDLVSFIDADDLWTPDKLELQYRALLENPECCLAYSWTVFIDEKSRYLLAKEPSYHSGNVYQHLLYGNFLESGSNMLVKKKLLDAIGGFDDTFVSAEDYDCSLRLAKQYPFCVVKEYQILYRFRHDSISSSAFLTEKYVTRIIEREFQKIPCSGLNTKNRILSDFYSFLVFISLVKSKNPERIKHAKIFLKKAYTLSRPKLTDLKTIRIFILCAISFTLPDLISSRLCLGLMYSFGIFTRLRSKKFKSGSISQMI